MKKVLFLALIVAAFTACKKDDEVQKTTDNNLVDVGAIAGYDYVTGPEGGELSLTADDGSTMEIEVTSVSDWETGDLLEGSYWRELSFTAELGTFFLRFNIPAGVEWQQGVGGEFELSTDFTLEDSEGMQETIVEMTCPSCPSLDGNITGEVTMIPSAVTNMGVYDGVVFVNASYNTTGGTTAFEGVFWADELE